MQIKNVIPFQGDILLTGKENNCSLFQLEIYLFGMICQLSALLMQPPFLLLGFMLVTLN